MNWSRTKLIFIMAFLVLDLYLGLQLYNKQTSADQVPSLPSDQTPLERLKQNDIKLPDIPEVASAYNIKGESKMFATEERDVIAEVAELEGSKGKKVQTLSIGDEDTILFSQLKKPLDVPDSDDYQAFLKRFVYQGSNYRFWKMDVPDDSSDTNGFSLIFAQTFNDRPVFLKGKSQTGSLQVKVEDGKIIGYTQTYLKQLSNYKKQKDILDPIKAIDKLDTTELPIGSTVETIEFGYYNLIQQDQGKLKVFVPVWHVMIKTDEDEPEQEYFVNGLNGAVQTLDKQDGDTG